MLVWRAMPCPFFLPLEKLVPAAWPCPPRLPLGQPYHGACTVDPANPWTPDENRLRELCSFGYARNRCARFPVEARADAIRFTAFEAGTDHWRVVWVLERDHAPIEHGEIRHPQSQAGDLLARQARAFLSSVEEAPV